MEAHSMGTASLISLLVLRRLTWRHGLHALRERANALPDHSQVVCGSQSPPLLDQEIEINEERPIRK
jgi:hypothetical protein